MPIRAPGRRIVTISTTYNYKIFIRPGIVGLYGELGDLDNLGNWRTQGQIEVQVPFDQLPIPISQALETLVTWSLDQLDVELNKYQYNPSPVR